MPRLPTRSSFLTHHVHAVHYARAHAHVTLHIHCHFLAILPTHVLFTGEDRLRIAFRYVYRFYLLRSFLFDVTLFCLRSRVLVFAVVTFVPLHRLDTFTTGSFLSLITTVTRWILIYLRLLLPTAPRYSLRCSLLRIRCRVTFVVRRFHTRFRSPHLVLRVRVPFCCRCVVDCGDTGNCCYSDFVTIVEDRFTDFRCYYSCTLITTLRCYVGCDLFRSRCLPFTTHYTPATYPRYFTHLFTVDSAGADVTTHTTYGATDTHTTPLFVPCTPCDRPVTYTLRTTTFTLAHATIYTILHTYGICCRSFGYVTLPFVSRYVVYYAPRCSAAFTTF